MAFRQAIDLEGDVTSRYIALAKAEEKLGNPKKAIEALEKAYDLDCNVMTLRQILSIYETLGDAEAIAATSARIDEQIRRESRTQKIKINPLRKVGSASKPTPKNINVSDKKSIVKRKRKII
jgi:tetratricopeptide (TPR) repeat protein